MFAQTAVETEKMPAFMLIFCAYSIYELTKLAAGDGLRIHHSIAEYYGPNRPTYMAYMIGWRSSFTDAPFRFSLMLLGNMAATVLVPYLVFVGAPA